LDDLVPVSIEKHGMTPPAFSSDTIAKLHVSAPSSLTQGSAGASGCALATQSSIEPA
jgi:hypothetical protein